MAICLLVRHGRTTANATGVLAGWTPGTALDDTGREQAARLGARLADVPLAVVVTSPLQRCLETTEELLHHIPGSSRPSVSVDDRVGEARYGAWTGRSLTDLAQDPLWRDVQDRPSQVVFPPHPEHEHEGLAEMSRRAVEALTEWNAHVELEHGPAGVWLAVSHGDVIKAMLAHALATPLDDFQRIVVDPASVSIVHQTSARPFVLRTNDTGSDPVDLSGLVARLTQHGPAGDAAVGGGAGDGSPRT